MEKHLGIRLTIVVFILSVLSPSVTNAQIRRCGVSERRVLRPLLDRFRCERQVSNEACCNCPSPAEKFCTTRKDTLGGMGGPPMCYLTGLSCGDGETVGMPYESCDDINVCQAPINCTSCLGQSGVCFYPFIKRSYYRYERGKEQQNGRSPQVALPLLIPSNILDHGIGAKIQPTYGNPWVKDVEIKSDVKRIAIFKIIVPNYGFHLVGLEVGDDVAETTGVSVDTSSIQPVVTGTEYVYTMNATNDQSDGVMRTVAVILARDP